MLRHALVESYMEHSLRDTNDDTQDKHDTHEGDAASGQLVRGLDACSLSPAARPLQAAAAQLQERRHAASTALQRQHLEASMRRWGC